MNFTINSQKICFDYSKSAKCNCIKFACKIISRYYDFGLGSDHDCEIENYFEEWKEPIWKEIQPIYAKLKQINSAQTPSPIEIEIENSPTKELDPLVDTFELSEGQKLDLNVGRILFECKTMKLVNVEKLKNNESK